MLSLWICLVCIPGDISGVTWVVWHEWCDMSGVACVVWHVWCDMSGVTWVVWHVWCGMCGVACVVWHEWCGMCGVACVVWHVWCGICGVTWVVWHVWGDMSVIKTSNNWMFFRLCGASIGNKPRCHWLQITVRRLIMTFTSKSREFYCQLAPNVGIICQYNCT